jgi:predicted Zn-dependent peptidase
MKLFLAILLMALPVGAQSTQPAQPMREAVQSFRLPNGLRVLLLENHQHPLIRLELRALWAPMEIQEIPASLESKGKGAIPKLKDQTLIEPLVLSVLEQCSVGNRSRGAFNRAVEERGLTLRISGGPDGPVWNLAGGSPEAESAFSLLADAATRPIPEGGDLDALRLRLINELHVQGSQETARINFLHVLERPATALEPITEKSLSQIYPEDLQRAIKTTLRPGRAVLAISGDLNLSQAKQLVQMNFGTWTEDDNTSAPTAPKPAVRTNTATKALIRPPVILPWDRSATSIALPFYATDEGQRAAQDLLRLWLPRYLGPIRCQIHPGAAWWRSLIITSEASEAALREELSELKKSGLKSGDLAQAKALWIAGRRALALHPQEQLSFAAKETLIGAEPSEQAIQEVDLATFNATLRAWLNIESARVLIFRGNQLPVPKTN